MDRYGRFSLGAALALGLVAATLVGSRALVRVKSEDQTIGVTGSAKRRIRSDLVIWSATVSYKGDNMQSAYKALAAATPKVVEYLKQKGLKPTEIVVNSIDTKAMHAHDKEGRELEETVTGYTMSQTIEVRSNDVDRVTEVARAATELINQGIMIDSGAPEYHYTRLGELKIQMLHEAAKDTRVRAQQIADATGAKLGPLRSARMGVMQINPADSSETSSEGNNDTSSLDKDVIAVVTSNFQLE
jgi:uncharacterized protein